MTKDKASAPTSNVVAPNLADVNWARDGIADFIETNWPHNEYWPPTIAERIRQIEIRPPAAPVGTPPQEQAALRTILRMADGYKEPCGMDPESPAAIRNGKFASIAFVAAQGLGLVRGPALDAAPRDAPESHLVGNSSLVDLTERSGEVVQQPVPPPSVETLHKLLAYCDDSDSSCYGTLSTSLVRELVTKALAAT